MARQTRVGIWGGPRPMWSSFAGKDQATAVAALLYETQPVIYRAQTGNVTYRPQTEQVVRRPKTQPMGGP